MTVFGWVTLVFALLDLNLPRLLQHAWADLKGAGAAAGRKARAAGGR